MWNIKTMQLKQKLRCEQCFRPTSRRLALFQTKDEYECYAESYVKCFWGLCDRRQSLDGFTTKSDGTVITNQPKRQDLPYKKSVITKDVALINK